MTTHNYFRHLGTGQTRASNFQGKTITPYISKYVFFPLKHLLNLWEVLASAWLFVVYVSMRFFTKHQCTCDVAFANSFINSAVNGNNDMTMVHYEFRLPHRATAANFSVGWYDWAWHTCMAKPLRKFDEDSKFWLQVAGLAGGADYSAASYANLINVKVRTGSPNLKIPEYGTTAGATEGKCLQPFD